MRYPKLFAVSWGAMIAQFVLAISGIWWPHHLGRVAAFWAMSAVNSGCTGLILWRLWQAERAEFAGGDR